MALPMTPTQITRQFNKWSVPYRELRIDGVFWTDHERDDETGKPFGPVFGGMQHHTGDDAPDGVDRNIIWHGRTGLPGPLAQFGLNDDGMVDLHSAGRSNHAGGGDPYVLQQVKNESYDKYPRAPRYHNGEPGSVDGNDAFYGCEAYYSGKRRMTAMQYNSCVLLWASVCDFHDWTAKSIIGHKEWSDWKSDPGSLDMYQLRMDIDEALRLGPPKQRELSPTRVTEFGELLDAALKYGESISETRNLVHDVREKIKIQRSRLPER